MGQGGANLDTQGLLNAVFDPVNQALRVSSEGAATPSGPAGGDLAGTYPNPTVAGLTHLVNPQAFAAVGTVAVSTSVTGDSSYRFQIDANGTLHWGNGTAEATRLTPVAGTMSLIGALTTSGKLACNAASGLGLDISTGCQIKFNPGTTGAGTALLGTNSPAVTNSAPFTWLQCTASDGSAIFVPAWK